MESMMALGRWWPCAVLSLALAAGCSGGGVAAGQKTCASDSGAQACLIPLSRANTYRLEATGFQPHSELQMTVVLPTPQPGSVPFHFGIGSDGKFSTGTGVLTLTSGGGPLTVKVAGMSGSGSAINLPVVLKR